ncbi:unnamed protein product [Clonostachys chloroleuca]|uniref:DJ-1/PfpI domain-containing protein n=1 Tax=Clonostachys chloroleuca TaxID=1926264 RepID=A0AA35MH44_9HYPO|nr:unnamed protein product [Clonostachys chloroleuca]
MKFSLFTALSMIMTTSVASASTLLAARNDSAECITPRPIPDLKGSDFKSFGVVLFRALDMLDVFGPLEPLQLLAVGTQQLNLHFIAETLDPISTRPASMNNFNSSFFPDIPVTNTFDDDLDLDVLIVPGGLGVRAPGLDAIEKYIKKVYPKVKLLITICTGARLAARSGVMDGRLATTNKNSWDSTTANGPNVKWVSPARYIRDGDIWSSSGVTSGLDLIFNFVKTYWGEEEHDRIAGMVEHVTREWDDDPFSAHYGIPRTDAQPCLD